MIEAPYEPFDAASDGRIRPLAMPNRQAHPPVCAYSRPLAQSAEVGDSHRHTRLNVVLDETLDDIAGKFLVA